MATVSMTGNDTITINGRLMTDLADGDVLALTFPNELAQVKTGKNGNSIYALNETGRQAEAVLRLIRGSADDKFMQGTLAQQQLDFAAFVLMTGEFVKRAGDGAGNVVNDTYTLSGGIHTKQVEAKMNTEGDSAQSVSEYHLKFANSPRAIG